MTSLLLATIVLLSIPQTGQDAVLDRLAKVQQFAFGPTGYAGVVSEGEKDYKTVLARRTALADFEKLFAEGNVQAKSYALVGIHKLNPVRFKQFAMPLIKSSEKVSIEEGCIVSYEPFNRVLIEIAVGKY